MAPKERGQFWSLAVLAFILGLCGFFWGCGQGEAPQSLSFQSTDAGILVTSKDERFRLLLPAGALPEGIVPTVTELATLPGFQGKTYGLEPAGLILNGPALVQLRKDPLLTKGETTAITLAGPVPLRTQLEGNFYQTEIVYFSRLGLASSTPVSDSDEARNRFLQFYLPSLKVLGEMPVSPGESLKVPYPQTTSVFGPFPMQPGQRVASSVRPYTVSPNQFGELVAAPAPKQEFTVDQPGDFFWLDLLDGALNQHPTLYVLLDRATGQFYERISGDHPVLDDQDLLASAEERAQSPFRLSGATLIPKQEPIEPPLRAQTGPTNCKRLALILSVTGEAYHKPALTGLQAALDRVGFDGRRYERVLSDGSQFSKLINDVLAEHNSQCQCVGFDEVFVFITGHGSVPNTTGFKSTFPFFQIGNNPEPGAGLDFKDANGKTVGQRTLGFDEIIDELSRLCLSPNGRFKVVLECCFSAELQDLIFDARERANANRLADRPISAADKRKVCFRGDIIVSNSRRGGFTYTFAGAYAQALAQKLQSQGGLIDLEATFPRTFEESTFNPVNNIFLGLQKPALRSFERQSFVGVNCDCDCPPPADLSSGDDESERVEFTHEVGVSPCPQQVATLRIVNKGIEPADIAAISSNPAILVAPGIRSNVPPGETVEFTVTYECSDDAVSFQTQITFVALTRVTNKEARLVVPVKATIVRGGRTTTPTPSQTPSPTPSPTETTTTSPTPTFTPGPGGCARVIFRNESSDPITIQFFTVTPTIHGGLPIDLAPGQTFSEDTATPIDNLDLIIFTETGPMPQGFEFDVPCGDQQVFIQHPFFLEFFNEPIP